MRQGRIIWLILVIVLVGSAAQRDTSFESGIMSLLPASQQQPVVRQASEHIADTFSRRVFVLVSADTVGVASQAMTSLAGELSAIAGVAEFSWQAGAGQLRQFDDIYFPYRFAILDESVRRSLQAEQYERLEQQALQYLYSPLAASGGSLIEDPFRLYTARKLNQRSELNIRSEQGKLRVSGHEAPTFLGVLTLQDSPFSPRLQTQIFNSVANVEGKFPQEVSVELSGMLVHAAAGARQAKSEIQTIGIGSLLGVTLLVWLAFRRWAPLGMMLLPVGIGCLVAVSVTVLIFPQVHLITFAFGAGLVGVSVDYALHFICERSAGDSATRVLYRLLPGLTLGLVSSGLAYAVQILTPFPGLQQMATFSVAGLLAAWLTVVLWLPAFSLKAEPGAERSANVLGKIRLFFPLISGKLLLTIFLGGVTVLAVISISQSRGIDDVRLLQTSPAALLVKEQRIQQLLGMSGSAQFLLVEAESLQALLVKEEGLREALDALVTRQQLGSYQALSVLVPSLQRQRENIALTGRLYQARITDYFASAGLPPTVATAALEQFSAYQDRTLAAVDWLGRADKAYWQSLLVGVSEHRVVSVIRFKGVTADTEQALQVLAADQENVYYVDRIQAISELMEEYREQITGWLGLAYLLILLILAGRYRVAVWRIITPPLLASVLTLGILVQLEQGINLFHLLALILVLGIGLDMGVFLTETKYSPRTWLAVTLSVFTSLLAFGLLALSATPVLYHFGLTVLLGLVFVWLLTVVFRVEPEGKTDDQ